MGSVIVKGMEMPKSCSKCGWFDMGGGYGYQCTLSHKSFDMWNKISVARDKDCPLVEIPTPHGRLIDVDGFKQDYSMGNECADCEQKQQGTLKSCEYDRIYSKMDFCQWLDDAETIIEAAEGSKTE